MIEKNNPLIAHEISRLGLGSDEHHPIEGLITRALDDKDAIHHAIASETIEEYYQTTKKLRAEIKLLQSHHIPPSQIENHLAVLDLMDGDPENMRLSIFRLTSEIKSNKKIYGMLLEFAKKNHESCEDCLGDGKIYKHADPTSGQWMPCPYLEAIEQAERK